MLPLLLVTTLIGIRTPSHNIACVDTGPSLICHIGRAGYSGALQRRCGSPPTSLDWHGFELRASGKGQIVCSGGVLVMGNVRYTTLAYGRTWRSGSYACTSRIGGLTCTNRAGHGLFISRASWRVW
ncbi:MAG: DUF6636 domain-containing protein [Gaiellaceae bacterium]